jgi:hypothetical protein
MGTPFGKWIGHYSIYLAPFEPDDEALVEGVSDQHKDAVDAEREGRREAEERAASMDAGDGLIGSDELIDGFPCRVLVRYAGHSSFYIDRVQPYGMASQVSPR